MQYLSFCIWLISLSLQVHSWLNLSSRFVLSEIAEFPSLRLNNTPLCVCVYSAYYQKVPCECIHTYIFIYTMYI